MGSSEHPNNGMLNLTKQCWQMDSRLTNVINKVIVCLYVDDILIMNHEVIVCLYVDDMLIMSKDINDINATKRMLSSKFDMKDLGVADLILEVRIIKTPHRLALSQSHYIEKVLDKFKF